jgi:hypothetical protein
MHNIRPYQLFTLFDAPISDRLVQVPLPSRRGLGGTTLLESFLLIAATRIVHATRIFEFGTFLGSTTLNIALNTPPDARIFTLDLDGDSAKGLRQDDCDAPLTGIHLSAGPNLDFMHSSVSNKIETIIGNSQQFDCSPWEGNIDLVFIDGGHDVPTASSDTKNALRMTRKDTLSCILWHDYRNTDCTALTEYLDELSQQIEMFHIENTMLCFCFQGPSEHFTKRLLTLKIL